MSNRALRMLRIELVAALAGGWLLLAPTLVLSEAVEVAPEADWNAFLARGELDTVLDTYAVLDRFGSGEPSEVCQAVAAELDSGLQSNPFSPALQLRWQQCRDLLADAATESTTALAADHKIRRDWLRRDGRGASMHRPIEVVTEMDASALIQSLGWEPLYARYAIGASNGSLPLVARVFDPQFKREQMLYFEFLPLWQALSRDQPDAAYPAYLFGLSERYLEESAAAGNGNAELAQITQSLGRGELTPELAVEQLEALALGGHVPAAFELLPLCALLAGRANCERSAHDLVAGLAGRGYAEGMVVMALATDRGIGTAVDARASKRWLKDAARRMGEVESLIAYAQLSASVDRGQPLAKSTEAALRQAARKGSAAALLGMAQALAAERMKKRFGESAERFLERAAAAGSNPARVQLAMSYLQQQQAQRAWPLIDAAARDGDGTALGLLGLAYENGSMGRERDPARALEVLRQAAQLGNSGAMRRLGRAWRRGELDLAADAQVAEGWYLSAAIAGNNPAALELAEMYLQQPPGFETHAEEGYALLQRLADEGVEAAKLRLATALLLGQGVQADPDTALQQLQALEQDGQAGASFRLGQAFEFGQGGVTIDLQRARTHYQRAAEGGSLPALDYYARMLYAGQGGERDRVAALTWWQRAAERGHLGSGNNLAWVRCSSRDPAVRNPAIGVITARTVLQRRRDATIEDTHAACLAAIGEFDQAIEMQLRAIESAREDEAIDSDERARFAERLALYERGEPWQED